MSGPKAKRHGESPPNYTDQWSIHAQWLGQTGAPSLSTLSVGGWDGQVTHIQWLVSWKVGRTGGVPLLSGWAVGGWGGQGHPDPLMMVR